MPDCNTDIKNPALLYGMQRTGSNYTEQVIVQNFSNIQFHNDSYSRCLPTHTHFRLYDEKSIIPEAKYLHSFTYRDFRDFKKHVEQILQRDINIFIVSVKNPYSWYVSYKKHAKRNKYIYYKDHVNSHYIADYNLYYKKWVDFSIQVPDEILIIRYEDLIKEFVSTLDKIRDTFNLEKRSEIYVNPEKVPMSRAFSEERRLYYKNEKFLDMIDSQEKKVIENLLDAKLISSLGY